MRLFISTEGQNAPPITTGLEHLFLRDSRGPYISQSLFDLFAGQDIYYRYGPTERESSEFGWINEDRAGSTQLVLTGQSFDYDETPPIDEWAPVTGTLKQVNIHTHDSRYDRSTNQINPYDHHVSISGLNWDMAVLWSRLGEVPDLDEARSALASFLSGDDIEINAYTTAGLTMGGWFFLLWTQVTCDMSLMGSRSGRDTLVSGSGDDWIFGFGGDDAFFAGDGDDHLHGGEGNDALWAGNGQDTLDGGAGNDTLGAGGGSDRLTGKNGDDVLWTGAGDDTAEGGTGNDTLGGGPGNDSLLGGEGADEAWGAGGDDTLLGGGGKDRLGGGNGNDSISGEFGDDEMFGGAGDDTLNGSDGNDSIYSASGNDRAIGGAGDDLIYGGSGNDTLIGDTGADDFVFTANFGLDVVHDLSAADGDRIVLGQAFRQSSKGPLTEAEVIMRFGRVEDGAVTLDFGDDERIVIWGINDIAQLEGMISFL